MKIRSADQNTSPKIQFNYLNEHQDQADWIKAIQLTEEILQQPALHPYRGKRIAPNINLDSEQELLDWVKANVESAYHPCGTCRMGLPDDPMAVVDNEGRVIGIKQLRVVDASIFPEITNGNLNAPTIMVAERLSDAILQKPYLKPDPTPYWQPKQWQTQQRTQAPSDMIKNKE